MFDKSVYVRRRKTLVAKMAESAAEGKRGIALFVGNAEAQAACAFCGVKVRTPVAGVSSVISNFVLVSVWVVRLGYTYLSLAKVVPFSSPR